jgi:two-component system invasion response regulator UvrY
MKINNKTSVALVDDHVLLRGGLASVVNSFIEYSVIFQADNGKHFIEQIEIFGAPTVVLMDINMPQMDGYLTTRWIKDNFPSVYILGLSMYDDENAIVRMYKAGASGYILKDCEPLQLKNALDSLTTKGFYYSEVITSSLIHSISKLIDGNKQNESVGLSDREIEFLKLACTEMTYKEIAEKMFLSPRTIDGYRDNLFEKLNIKTRVGLVMYAIKNGIVEI